MFDAIYSIKLSHLSNFRLGVQNRVEVVATGLLEAIESHHVPGLLIDAELSEFCQTSRVVNI